MNKPINHPFMGGNIVDRTGPVIQKLSEKKKSDKNALFNALKVKK